MPLLITSGNLALTGLRLSWTLLLNIVRSLTVGLKCVVLIFIADQFLNINVQVRTCDGLLAPYTTGPISGIATYDSPGDGAKPAAWRV